jgi:hypothetical protein
MKQVQQHGEIPESVLRELERKPYALGRSLQPVGYWGDRSDQSGSLPDPHDLVDASWDRGERRRVVKYLRAGREALAYKGSAACRFGCGAAPRQMGYRDLTDDEYVWPEGFAHYLEAHAVKPPESFLEHVRRKLAEQPPRPLQRLARLFSR